MAYNFKEIESKWQSFWAANQTFKAEIDNSKPKYYVLDMFPYPSGSEYCDNDQGNPFHQSE